ncbi:TetR/AcrR family transcriptional regulator [Nostoc flagelliforme FACHB-838]|uniref:TetR/AcrR family transcriptional regulator n=1 Tax=Nostoc flagelliforme FACHB-838 TaxID=2692904 RepID=A0ABR8E4L7_9NOSO|nr:TetR/AcrR family transcriptional regulator [Nostoc flagelliforme]MBD2536255.1 TetR/AcrR family transcriptional regulator [Nostoc flagelliforme FACHB-838]
MEGKSSRQEQALVRREQLVDTALALFSKQGYDATSIKQIAAAEGVAVGLLYHYFPSKSAVMRAIWERHSFLPELRALLLVEHNETAERVLRDVAERFSAMLAHKEALFRLMVRESQSNPEVADCLHTIVEEGIKALGAYLERRVHLGELRPHDTALTARTLLGTVLTTHLARLPIRPWAELVAQLLHGISRHSDHVRPGQD